MDSVALLERRAIHPTGVCPLRDYLTTRNHRSCSLRHQVRSKVQGLELLPRRFRCERLPNTARGIAAVETEERARGLLSHSNRSDDLAAVIERTLDVLLERTDFAVRGL